MFRWIKYVPVRTATRSFAINAYKALGLPRRRRACHLHLDQGARPTARRVISWLEQLKPFLPPINGLTGLEIGPGDNMGVAECALANGAARMVCAEQLATVRDSAEMRALIAERYGAYTTRPELVTMPFELIEGSFDFIYSVDVLEHVSDVSMAIRQMARLMKPGATSVHSVDFAGHNAYVGTGIDFLTCPDWIWSLLHSHLETTNRIRFGELLRAVENAGLELVSAIPTESVEDARVEALRPEMLKRYRDLPTAELKVLQGIVVFRKPHNS
jgi:SAM-dependent methyltransferase